MSTQKLCAKKKGIECMECVVWNGICHAIPRTSANANIFTEHIEFNRMASLEFFFGGGGAGPPGPYGHDGTAFKRIFLTYLPACLPPSSMSCLPQMPCHASLKYHASLKCLNDILLKIRSPFRPIQNKI